MMGSFVLKSQVAKDEVHTVLQPLKRLYICSPKKPTEKKIYISNHLVYYVKIVVCQQFDLLSTIFYYPFKDPLSSRCIHPELWW